MLEFLFFLGIVIGNLWMCYRFPNYGVFLSFTMLIMAVFFAFPMAITAEPEYQSRSIAFSLLLLLVSILGIIFFPKLRHVREKKILEENQKKQEILAKLEQTLEQQRQQKLKTRQGLYSLTPREFELAVAEILQANSYSNVEVTKFVGDVGADIIVYKDERKYVVQCKQYSEEMRVGTPELQRLQGALLGYRADAMIFVTLGFFSKNALEYAKKNGIELIDGNELIDMAQSLNKLDSSQ